MKNGCHRSVGDFGPVEEGAEGFCGFRLALGVRFGRCIFRHHQRRGIQGDLKSSAGSIHARVIDGHADCAYERHGDHRHQRGYTAPGVLEKTGQHRLTQRLLKTIVEFLHMGVPPLKKRENDGANCVNLPASGLRSFKQ